MRSRNYFLLLLFSSLIVSCFKKEIKTYKGLLIHKENFVEKSYTFKISFQKEKDTLIKVFKLAKKINENNFSVGDSILFQFSENKINSDLKILEIEKIESSNLNLDFKVY